MKNRICIQLLTGLTSLCLLPLGSRGQTSLTLDKVIRLSQDSAITAFQSRQEYQSRQLSYEAFEALRKPQLTLKVVPNYSRIVSDPSRDYVYLRNYVRWRGIHRHTGHLERILPRGCLWLSTPICGESAVGGL